MRAQGEQARIPYQVEASAKGYPASSGYPETRYEISSVGQVPGKRAELRIIDAQVLPQPAFEEPGDTVTLTAQAVLIASDANPEDIEWTVNLLDRFENLVQEELASGTGPHISVEWDGTVAGQVLEHPAWHQFEIQATLCDSEPPIALRGRSAGILAQDTGGECLEDRELVAFENLGVLKVFASEVEIANSKDRAKRGGPDNDAGFKRLGTVHAAETWKLELSGLDFGAESSPETLSGFAISSVSSPSAQEPVTLTKDPNRESVYITDFEPSTLLKTGPQLGNTLYSVGAGVALKEAGGTLLISHLYADLLADILKDTMFYPADRKELGRLVYTGLLGRAGATEPEIHLNEAEFEPSNLKKFGFEAILITILTPNGPLDVTVKVQNRASDFATFSHGLFDGRLLLGTSDSGVVTVGPEDLDDDEVSHLKTWIFNACNVLICYDYNNNLADRTDLGRQGRADPISVRAPGAHGLRWWNKLNKGRTVLLGYNFPVEVRDAANAMTNFGSTLDSTFSIRDVVITPQNKQQWAWMVGNAKSGESAWNACAWDSEFYYYLAKYDSKFDSLFDSMSQDNEKDVPEQTILGIVRMPLDLQTGVPSYIDGSGHRVPFEPKDPQGPPQYAQIFDIP